MKSERPKVLHCVLGRPLIQYPLEILRSMGIESPIVVVGHQAERVAEVVRKLAPSAVIVEQKEQKGTGHAVQMAVSVLESLHGSLLVLPGDDLLLKRATLERLFFSHVTSGTRVSVLTAEVPDPTGYGRIIRDGGELKRIIEEKDASPEDKKISEINSSVYLFDLEFIKKHIQNLRPENAQREYYLTDLIPLASETGGRVEAVKAGDWTEVLGINDRCQLVEAENVIQKQLLDSLMCSGVTLEKPETVLIEADVTFGKDVTVGPFTTIRGKSRVGDGARIGSHVVMMNSEVGKNSVIESFSHLDGAVVGENCSVGPFARLRAGSQMLKESKVGNFVEMKKSVLGEGSKANHLTYLGDAEIGAKVNVGAGTITCNYDGYAKNKTIIEDGVFVGSNSSLVAPVRIGEGALIGAGSVITENVKKDALALGRAKQKSIAGWAKKFHKKNQKKKGA